MASVKRKHEEVKEIESDTDQEDLFVDAPADDSSDLSDSEESEFSGLEEEPDTDEEEEEEEEEEDADSTDTEPESDNNERDNDEYDYDSSDKNKQNNDEYENSNKQDNDEYEDSNKQDNDEYEYDSSDEEDVRNTVGNIPIEWYREYAHIGYDLSGKKIIKPKAGDEMDDFLSKMENPDYWRTVKDKLTGQNVVLSDKDMELVERFRRGKFVDPKMNPYEPTVEYFSSETMETPLTAHPPQKRSFIPSLLEKRKVGQLVHHIKMGWLKPSKPRRDPYDEEEEEMFHELWKAEDEGELSKHYRHHIPAPKMALPGHAESYNPPEEFLFTEEEELAWREQDPEERRINFIPRKYKSLREVPQYEHHMEERFHRCLDLYLCPRQRKMRMNVNPEDLLPKLPKPRELQPFPNMQNVVFRGHTGLVRSISVSPLAGKYLASGSDDGTLRLWEVQAGRCSRTLDLGAIAGGAGGGVVRHVAWNPNPNVSLVAAAVGNDIVLVIPPGLSDSIVSKHTENMLATSGDESNKSASVATWNVCTGGEMYQQGVRLTLQHVARVEHMAWHSKGDYLAVVLAESKGKATVIIHQLSRRRSQNPFKKPKGIVQRVMFHPTRPYLFVATQRYVRVYNLLKQELTKKLMTNCKWLSSMAVHPGGDNIIIGSYDCKLGWFDLDLSAKPYQTLRHHKKAVRAVSFHPRLPLFASASDDGTVIVCHGRVYNDLMQNPLIVPVKVLRGHETTKNLGVLDVVFHPTQPWLFSSGADNTIRLFSD